MTKDAPQENPIAESPEAPEAPEADAPEAEAPDLSNKKVKVEEPVPAPEEVNDSSTPSEIVENLTIPVSIELSRLRLSIKELGALKNGQILDLNKSPGDLVDLVVSGKVIGKGELVEIEGELGVRISSLVK